MSKSPWGTIGNWAAEAERAEAEEREAAAHAPPPTSFPSLKEAASTAKQKKKTKMTLQEFTMQQSTYSGSRSLTHEEMLRLPTGPKERDPDELQHGRLGGGFSNYGSRTGSAGPNAGRARGYESGRSYGFEDDNRRGTRVSEYDQPSRADEVDNWGSMKKQSLPGGKYGSLGGGGGPDVASRADEVDNWASVKKHTPQTQQQTRSSSFGSGFSRPEPDRWSRNEQSFASGFSRPEPDRWGRSEQKLVLNSPKNEVETTSKVNKPNPFGAARPREDVLAEKGLDWKKLDLEIEVKQKQGSVTGGSRPSSSQSSRPETPNSSAPIALGGMSEGVVKQKPKVNPFGDAKPREVLLEEKGLDWKKIDLELEHRRVERPETEEESILKEEIEHLKKELLTKSGEDQTSIQGILLQKEQDLELLTRQLDDKVRYSQKIFERQSSGASRGPGFNERPSSRPGSHEGPRTGFHDRPPSASGPYEQHRTGYPERPPSRPVGYDDSRAGFTDRPPSRPGAYEENRSVYPQRSSIMHGAYQESRGGDYNENERPRSRGATNSWTRQTDDRRSFESGWGRASSGSGGMERSGSRW